MDIFAHGLWSYVSGKALAKKRKERFTHHRSLSIILGGIAPDLIAFIPLVLLTANQGGDLLDYPQQRFQDQWGGGVVGGVVSGYPGYFFYLYGLSHSLLIVALVALFFYAADKIIPYFIYGWGIHVVFDIFTHEGAFASKIFYPLTDFSVHATTWSNPIVFACTYIALLVVYLLVYNQCTCHTCQPNTSPS